MSKKKYVKRLRILLIGEGLFKNFYLQAGMKNMMKLSPLIRLKFWSGLIKILSVGYFFSLFLQGITLILLLIVMNMFCGWWCYKWKVYLLK